MATHCMDSLIESFKDGYTKGPTIVPIDPSKAWSIEEISPECQNAIHQKLVNDWIDKHMQDTEPKIVYTFKD